MAGGQQPLADIVAQTYQAAGAVSTIIGADRYPSSEAPVSLTRGQVQSLCSTPLGGPSMQGTALKYSQIARTSRSLMF